MYFLSDTREENHTQPLIFNCYCLDGYFMLDLDPKKSSKHLYKREHGIHNPLDYGCFVQIQGVAFANGIGYIL